MKFLKKQWSEEMKNWIKETTVEENEKLNKVKIAKKKKHKIIKDAKDVVQKDFCKHSLHASKNKNKKAICYIRKWKQIFKNIIDHNWFRLQNRNITNFSA